MITIKNLTLKYGNQIALNKINLELPSKGLVALFGPSGCGKTSLFNCLSGLVKYEGEIKFDGTSLSSLNEKKMNEFRLHHIGFVFQDFKLFNLDTVKHNIAFPFDVLNGYSSSRNKRRILDLLNLVRLKDKENEIIKNLSGGEKQRVAIARSLANNPSLILADEPTGALDEENAENIMSLLRSISKDKLVIVISHDQDLVSKYADKIVELKDGKIKKITNQSLDSPPRRVSLISSEYHKAKPSIPFSFLVRHTTSSIKERKWRTLLVNLVTSLSLIGVGLATSLSNSISVNIKKACSSLLSEEQIMLSSKEKSSMVTLEGMQYFNVIKTKESYPEYVEDVGAIYEVNFNNHFKDADEFYLKRDNTKLKISNYSSKHINEYKWLDYIDRDFFPYKPESLENDELVLNLSLGMVYDICLQLQILRTVESLSDYILDNDLFIIYHARNNAWEYDDEQIFKIKAFSLDYELGFYHYNHLWNEDIFEKEMRFPSSLKLALSDTYPWTMKKLYYIKTNIETKEEFLSKIKYNENFDPFLFEIASYQYFPLTYKYEDSPSIIDHVLVLKNNMNSISPRMVNKVKEVIEEIDESIIGTPGGYSIYEDALLMGFSSYTYFTFDKELLEDTLSNYSSLPTLSNQQLNIPSSIALGHYSKSMQNGVIFHEISDFYKDSFTFSSLGEVVISQGMLNCLGEYNTNIINVGYTVQEEKLPNGKMRRDFKYTTLKIIGIIEGEDKVIYQKSDWLIDFFKCRLGVSTFNLGITTIAFSLKDDADFASTLSLAQKAFPSYKVTNPLGSINDGIDEICFYLEYVMYIFSLIAIIISIFLLSICNYLHILEIKKDIGLSRCIGVSKMESTKFIFIHAYFMAFVSFLVSSIELVFLNYFISKIIASYLMVSFTFSLNFLSFLYMFLLAFVISTVSSFLISLKVIKYSPLESLKVE